MLHFRITNDQQRDEFTHGSGPIEMGRSRGDDRNRFVLHDRYVSRRQLRVEAVRTGTICVTNLGNTPIELTGGETLTTAQSLTFDLPTKLLVGNTQIEIRGAANVEYQASQLRSLSLPIAWNDQQERRSLQSLGNSPSLEKLTHWFETLLSVQKAAAGSTEFYGETVRAVVELIGLDCGMVVLREDGNWRIVAHHTVEPGLPVRFSHTVLTQVLEQRRTFYDIPADDYAQASLANVDVYVASPITDAKDRVIGALFGSRNLKPQSVRQQIEPLEAQMVQLIAGAVSVGLARLEREAAAMRLQVQLEQFASPEVARALQRDPNLLEPRHREITVVFADVRGFSRFAERLDPATTYRLIRDMMDCFTNCVVEHGGFIIHYAGDGLAAMWNAPTDQPDHPQRACTAALAMQAELPQLNTTWHSILGRELEVGIGVHTGTASVGNAGSRLRMKYGALGHTLNVASRIEGATKHLRLPVLITAETQARLPESFATRRLCKVRAVGLETSVQLYELHCGTTDIVWMTHRDRFERALECLEQSNLLEARSILDTLLAEPALESDFPLQWLDQWCKAHSREYKDGVLYLDSK